MSDSMTDVEQRIYDGFVDGRHELEHDLQDLVDCATKLLERTKHGRRFTPQDMDDLCLCVMEAQLSQGRLSVLQELVDAMDRV